MGKAKVVYMFRKVGEEIKIYIGAFNDKCDDKDKHPTKFQNNNESINHNSPCFSRYPSSSATLHPTWNPNQSNVP